MDSLSFLRHFNIKRFITLCFKSWPVFLLTVGCCVVLAAAIAVIKKPKSEIKAQIILKDETSGSSMMLAGQIARSFSLGDMFGGSSTTDNETFMLHSHTVFVNTARQLDLNTSYFSRRLGILWKVNIEEVPIHLEAPENVSDTISTTLTFMLSHIDADKYDVSVKAKKKIIAEVKDGIFPIDVSTPYGDFTIDKTEYFSPETAKDYKITYCSYGAAASNYEKLVDIYVPDRRSDVIAISYITSAPDFGKRLIDHIINNYVTLSNQYKLGRTTQSLALVDNRLATLAQELKLSEAAIEDFKLHNNLTDPEVDAQYLLSKTGELESSLMWAQTNYEISRLTLDFISNPENRYALVPQLLTGSSSSSDNTAPLISQYNELILERMNLLTSVKEGNSSLTLLDKKIDAMRENIVVSVERACRNSKVTLDELKSENSKNKLRIDQLPTLERNYLVLKRDNLLQEQIYLFLLQQREELNMNIQSRSMPAQVIDAPYEVDQPVGLSTKGKLVFGVLFGLMFGAIYVLFKKMGTSPLSTTTEITKALEIPVLQTLSSVSEASIDTTGTNAEGLRHLRSNAEYALTSCEGKVITVTSMHPSADKNYVAINLAATMSLTGRRILLIDMDLRDPKVANTLKINASDSIIDYANSGIPPTITTVNADGASLDVMASTQSTPYPSDIAASERFATLLLGNLQQDYDTVVINASPIKGYSDIYDLTALTDITLICCPSKSITPDDIDELNKLHADGRLKRMAAVVLG